jgi:hypothetical protein
MARIGRAFGANRREERERVLQDSSNSNSELAARFDATRRTLARPDRRVCGGDCVGCAVADGLKRSLGRQERAFCRRDAERPD